MAEQNNKTKRQLQGVVVSGTGYAGKDHHRSSLNLQG